MSLRYLQFALSVAHFAGDLFHDFACGRPPQSRIRPAGETATARRVCPRCTTIDRSRPTRSSMNERPLLADHAQERTLRIVQLSRHRKSAEFAQVASACLARTVLNIARE